MRRARALLDLDRVGTCGRYLVQLDRLVDQELEIAPEPVDDVDHVEVTLRIFFGELDGYL